MCVCIYETLRSVCVCVCVCVYETLRSVCVCVCVYIYIYMKHFAVYQKLIEHCKSAIR